jgi:hypothetical protein
METLTGIFASSTDACRATRWLESILNRDDIAVLIPGDKANAERLLATPESDEPGEIGQAVTVKTKVPGVGRVIGLGSLGGVLLRSLGTGTGQPPDAGAIPHSALFVYEDALRRGRSVLTAAAADDSDANSVRELLKQEGAETVDTEHDAWWIGRPNEDPHASASGDDGNNADEEFYRLGYEAALHAKYRCMEYDQILGEMQADLEEMQELHPYVALEKPFTKGFEKGIAHGQAGCQESIPSEQQRQTGKTNQ